MINENIKTLMDIHDESLRKEYQRIHDKHCMYALCSLKCKMKSINEYTFNELVEIFKQSYPEKEKQSWQGSGKRGKLGIK